MIPERTEAVATIERVQKLLHALFDSGNVIAGRWCNVCRSDLSDVDTPTPNSNVSPWPQGGHAPDCPAALLSEWLDGPSVYTRRRDT